MKSHWLVVLVLVLATVLTACTTKGETPPSSRGTPAALVDRDGPRDDVVPEAAELDAPSLTEDGDVLEETPAPQAEPAEARGTPAENAPDVNQAPVPPRFESATLVRVVDGDTIVVRLESGHEDRVRYIGVDTPETVAPGQAVQPFGLEASARNAALLAGEELFLERDISDRDRFDRLLRYVWVRDVAAGDLVMVNEVLVAEGLASVSTFPPDVKHIDRLRAAEAEARAREVGIWLNASRPPSDVVAGGGCDDAYPGVCIPPPPPDLDCGDVPFRRFEVVGADPHRFDGDNNGLGCES